MPEWLATIQPTTLAAPVFLISVIWEWWAVRTGRAKGRYETKDAVASMAMGIGNVVVNTLTGMVTIWLMM
ncbi:MAG: sterol desaturase family protein, partial [Alphaproteobacteria bacterium]|nr:sterol desaturase family protein [Alphaproteobacteria bacterium]